MKQVSLLFLTAALLAASLFSCGGDSGTPDTQSMPDHATTAAPAETEPARITADLPERDFGGRDFSFYGRIYDGVWSAIDLFSHEMDGELINDSVYARTAYIEETYNVKLTALESQAEVVTSYLKTLITSGDDSFEAIVCDVYDSGALAVEGMLLDLHDVEHIDLSKQWWSQSMNETFSIANRQFYATGDIFIIDNKATRVFYFNKDLIRDLDLENPYDLVDQNKWTMDRYIAASNEALYDLNGDNTYTRESDRFGTMAQTTLGSLLYFAAGGHLTGKDENDLPYALCNSADAIEIMTGISEKIAGVPSIIMADVNNLNEFMDGRVLFAPEVLLHIETMRDCEVDIGILPAPKYDETQESYACYADGWCVNVVSIPTTNTNPEDAGFLLEAMAADSLNNLTPAYFDVVLTDKYARDEQSVRMLDLILDSVVMDNANIFSWVYIESNVAEAIYKSNVVASTMEKRAASLEKAIAKTVDAIMEID